MIQMMSPYSKRIFLKALGILVAGCAMLMTVAAVAVSAAEPERKDEHPSGSLNAPNQNSPVHLYFTDRSSYFLRAEQRVVLHSDDPLGLAGSIIQALIKGPQESLLRTIPADTRLNAVYITPDRTCYVDLTEAVRKNHPGGSKSELLTIYSLVNSLVLNVPEIERVQLLIDGNQVPTLAGHVDLERPVKADMLLIR
jgi:spore germination protein GerM